MNVWAAAKGAITKSTRASTKGICLIKVYPIAPGKPQSGEFH
jgi:hypothetical protein